MQIFIEVIDLNIWEAIEFDPFIPTMVERNATIEKPREEEDNDFIFFVKRFNKFLRIKKKSKEIKHQSKEERRRFLLSPKTL